MRSLSWRCGFGGCGEAFRVATHRDAGHELHSGGILESNNSSRIQGDLIFLVKVLYNHGSRW